MFIGFSCFFFLTSRTVYMCVAARAYFHARARCSSFLCGHSVGFNDGQCLRKPSAATLKSGKKKQAKSFIVIIRPQPKQTNELVTGGGESLETVQRSKIKTKQQRLLPYFFVTHEFNCLFLFGESAYVNYALLCWREIRVKNIFQHKHKHFDRMQT